MLPNPVTPVPNLSNLSLREKGYPGLAHFVASDQDFFIFRKFDELAARSYCTCKTN